MQAVYAGQRETQRRDEVRSRNEIGRDRARSFVMRAGKFAADCCERSASSVPCPVSAALTRWTARLRPAVRAVARGCCLIGVPQGEGRPRSIIHARAPESSSKHIESGVSRRRTCSGSRCKRRSVDTSLRRATSRLRDGVIFALEAIRSTWSSILGSVALRTCL